MRRGTPPALVTPAATALVTVAQARDQARIDSTHEDAFLQVLIDAAVADLDGYSGILGRSILPQTWRQDFEGWGDLRLALPDVSEVTVTYRDDAGDMQPAEDAELIADDMGNYVTAEGPETELVRVQYVAGMPAKDLPRVRQAVLMQVAMRVDDRIGADGVSLGAMHMIAPLRAHRV